MAGELAQPFQDFVCRLFGGRVASVDDRHTEALGQLQVAAAEVAVGLALIVAIFRTKQSIDIDELHQMEG